MATKKTVEEKKERKNIELTQINPELITIQDGMLLYKRVRVPFVEFSAEFKNQIEGLVAHALHQVQAQDCPIRLNKIEFEGKTYKILEDVKEMMGNTDNMAAGAILFANIPKLEHFVGLYYHDLWIGDHKHFKQAKNKKVSVKTLDSKKLPKLPTV